MTYKVDDETRAEHRARLLELLPPGSRVRCVLRHVSASGMTRWLDLYTVEDGELVYLSGYAESVFGGYPRRDFRSGAHEGLKVSGAGMDMGFWTVYELARALYPDGFDCIGDGREPCPRCEGTGHHAVLEDGTPVGGVCIECDGAGWTGRYTGPRCPSNDHSNGDRDYTVGRRHPNAGGYALRSEWI